MKKYSFSLFGLLPFLKIEVYGHKVKVYLFGLMILRMRKPIVDRMEKLKDISYDDIFAIVQEKDRIQEFVSTSVEENTILIVEPNMRYHGECLAGYVKMFNDLGYNVHIIMGNDSKNLGVFDRCSKLNVKVFGFDFYKSMLAAVNTQDLMLKYKKVIITTALDNDGEMMLYRINYPWLCSCVFHSIRSMTDYGLDFMEKEGKGFVISYFGNNNLKTINPHYFGDTEVTPKNKDVIEFVTIGRIQKDVKNYNLLKDSIKSLLKDGITNFRVNVIGWAGNMDIEEDIKPYINFLGKLSFPDMYSVIEKSDFLLSLLDCENEKHLLYTKDLATGSNQLVLGFEKPYLISKVYADAYRYNDSNAIIYNDNDLPSAMKRAMKITDEEYEKMQKSINKLANELEDISKKNIVEWIENA